jgi:hypothetical protein
VGYFGLSRALGDRDVERAARLKIQGPSGNREIEMRMFFLVGVLGSADDARASS